MLRSSFRPFALAAAIASMLFTQAAFAGSSESTDKPADDSDAAKDKEKDGKKAGETDKTKTEAPPDAPASLREDPMKAYYYLNLRFRDIVVPKFMIDLFASGGATVNAMSFGPELTRRKDGTEMDFALSYADYSMDPFLFKGKSDGEESYELVSSTLKLWYATIDILYEIPIDDSGRFAFLIGGGVGFAGVTGNLYRNQVYPNNGSIDPNNPASVSKCAGAGQPNVVAASSGIPYCDASNKHYGNYSEASWANGGSLPFIFPWIALPQISLRFKPIKQVQIRADVGFSTSGFYFGMSGGYGLPIGGLATDGGSSSSAAPKN